MEADLKKRKTTLPPLSPPPQGMEGAEQAGKQANCFAFIRLYKKSPACCLFCYSRTVCTFMPYSVALLRQKTLPGRCKEE